MQLLPEIQVTGIFQDTGLCGFNLLQQLQILGVVTGKGNIFKFDKGMPVDLDLRIANLEHGLRTFVLICLELEQEVEFQGIDILEPAEEVSVLGVETLLESP